MWASIVYFPEPQAEHDHIRDENCGGGEQGLAATKLLRARRYEAGDEDPECRKVAGDEHAQQPEGGAAGPDRSSTASRKDEIDQQEQLGNGQQEPHPSGDTVEELPALDQADSSQANESDERHRHRGGGFPPCLVSSLDFRGGGHSRRIRWPTAGLLRRSDSIAP